MRMSCFAILAALIATPVLAQPYNGGPPPSVHDWHAAHRAEEVARQRAAVGDYEGAARAHNFAQQKRYEAHELRQQGY